MPPQRTVRTGRSRKKGARGSSKKKKQNTADESYTGKTPRLVLKFKPPTAEQLAAEEAQSLDGDFVEKDEEGVEQLPVITTRSGRAVKAKKLDDFVYSDDYNSQLASSPLGKTGQIGGDFDDQYGGSTSTRK